MSDLYTLIQVPSPIKDRSRATLRKRSSSLLKRKRRKELEKIFPLASEEQLLRSNSFNTTDVVVAFNNNILASRLLRPGTKCLLGKEKGKLYVTNRHVGFYEKKKAGVWLDFSQITDVIERDSALVITDVNSVEVQKVALP